MESDIRQNHEKVISPILYILTSLTILWLMNYDRCKGMLCSGLLFTFWLLVTVTMIPDVIDYTIDYEKKVGDLQK